MLQLNHVLFGNSVIVWGVALAAALALAGALRLARGGALRYLARRPDSPQDRYLAALARSLQPVLMVLIAISLAANIPVLPPRLDRGLQLAGPLALLAQAALWGHVTVRFWLEAPLAEGGSADPAAATRASVVGFILRLALGSLVLLLGLSLLGYNITTLLASLGIGGIAVALAVQNVLGDVFASLSIALDKPFMVGDFIIVDDCLGAVEYVGLKTTRVRSLSGEQLIFSNSDLLKSRIRNFERMAERRVLFTFAVACETPPDVLESLSARLRVIIEAQTPVRFDRANLKEFKDGALVFEVVFYVLDPDYNLYMDVQERINLALHRHLRAEGIAHAVPRRLIQAGANLDGPPRTQGPEVNP